MKRHSLLVVMAILLALAMATSCSTTPAPTQAPPASQAATPAPTVAPTPTPIPRSAISVEVFNRGNAGGTDPTNNYWTDWIKKQCLEKLNLDVTFVAVARSEEVPGLNSMMAAKTAPDLSFTYDRNVIYSFYKDGGLTDLTDSLAKYGTNLKAFLGDSLIARGQYSGRQYMIIARRINEAKFGTYIRKDWLDALKLPVPTTTEEYYNALKAFKEQNPGKVENVIPLTLTSDVIWRAGPLLESFIDPNISDKDLYINRVNDYPLLEPGVKEGVRLLNKMFNEGLIDPQFSLYKDDIASDDSVKRGQVGSLMHNWDWPYRTSPGDYKALKENVPTAEFIPIDPFKNAAGKTAKSLYDPAGIRVIVPVFSKNPDGVIRYLDWLAIQENRFYLQTGDLGETYDMVDGLPALKQVEGAKIMNSSQNIDYTIIMNGLDMGDQDKNIKFIVNSYPDTKDLADQAFKLSIKDGFQYPILETPLTSEAPVSATLKDKEKAVLAACLTCKPEDFDKTWDAQIAEYLAAGAQAGLDERKTIWDAEHK